jgi:hypothetical protein
MVFLSFDPSDKFSWLFVFFFSFFAFVLLFTAVVVVVVVVLRVIASSHAFNNIFCFAKITLFFSCTFFKLILHAFLPPSNISTP